MALKFSVNVSSSIIHKVKGTQKIWSDYPARACASKGLCDRSCLFIYLYIHITRGMQSIVGRAELAIAVQPHQRAAELSGLLHIVLLYEVGIR